MEKYTYTGPTMLFGENEEYKLSKGMEVKAEVNVNVATILTLFACGLPLNLDMGGLVVPAKYLEPVKTKPIHVDPNNDDGTGDFFDKLFGEIGKVSAKCHFPFSDEDSIEKYKESLRRKGVDELGKPSAEVLGNIRKAAHKANDNHEVGGTHYKSTIEPWDFIYVNSLDFDAGNAVKYLCRYKKKGGAEDIKKAISYCEHILKTQYKE